MEVDEDIISISCDMWLGSEFVAPTGSPGVVMDTPSSRSPKHWRVLGDRLAEGNGPTFGEGYKAIV